MYKVDTTDASDLSIKGEVQVVDSDELYYMQNVMDTIKNVNIREFNYIVFEEDIDNMYKTEFNTFFNNYIIDLIQHLDQYLSINIDELINEHYRVKHAFVKNIVRFFMNTLPYIYMKEYLENNGADGLHDALDMFNDDLKDNIIKQIISANSQYSNFNTMMNEVKDTITNEKKKDKFEGMLSLLESSMDNKSKLLDYYIDIIQSSGNDGLKSLFKLYLKNDLENLI